MERVESDQVEAKRGLDGASLSPEARIGMTADSETPVPHSAPTPAPSSQAPREVDHEAEGPPAQRTARWSAIIAPSSVSNAGPPAPVVAPPIDAPAAVSSRTPASTVPKMELAPSSAPPSRLGGEPWTVHPPPSRPASELLVLEDFPPPVALTPANGVRAVKGFGDESFGSEAVAAGSAATDSGATSDSDLPLGRRMESALPPRSAPHPSRPAVLASDRPTALPTLRPLLGRGKSRRVGSVVATATALVAAFALGVLVARRPADVAVAQPAMNDSSSLRVSATPTPGAPPSEAPAPLAPSEPAELAPGSTLEPSAKDASSSAKPPGGDFDARAVEVVLERTAARSRACKKGRSVSGSAVVAVTLSPSGHISNASVTGIESSPGATSCVARLFRGARVPHFSGAPVTVTKTVSFD